MKHRKWLVVLVALLAPAAGAQTAPAERVMGIWEGTAQARGNAFPFELTLAQWGTQVYGIGVMRVNRANPLFGRPAVRLDGQLEGSTLTLGMSGLLNNECFSLSPSATTAFALTVVHDAAAETLTATRVVPMNPIGCGQLFEAFTVARTDEPWLAGNHGILGTWEGQVAAAPGWVFTTIPAFHQRESFFVDSGVGLRGYLEFFPGGTWGEMGLTWNPATQRASYIYECVPQYVYVGVIDGNKFTGVFKPADQPNASFIGVFSHTLQEIFVEPGPLATPCE